MLQPDRFFEINQRAKLYRHSANIYLFHKSEVKHEQWALELKINGGWFRGLVPRKQYKNVC